MRNIKMSSVRNVSLESHIDVFFAAYLADCKWLLFNFPFVAIVAIPDGLYRTAANQKRRYIKSMLYIQFAINLHCCNFNANLTTDLHQRFTCAKACANSLQS